MIRHLFKLFWYRKRSNSLLLLEIFICFIAIFGVSSVSVVQLKRYLKPLGFDYDDIYIIDLDMKNRMDIRPDADDGNDFQKCLKVIEELRGMPEVVYVSSVLPDPYGFSTFRDEMSYGGRTVTGKQIEVSDEAFDLFNIQIQRGRKFHKSDNALDWKPVVINRLMVKELFQDEDPLGKVIDEDGKKTVVGVIDDFRFKGEFSKLEPTYIIRRNLSKMDGGYAIIKLAVRVKPGTPVEFEEVALNHLQQVDSNWIIGIKLLSEKRKYMLTMEFTPYLIGAIVVVFLMIMVTLGMIGVFWQSITARTHEIGLRHALGGNRRRIYWQLILEIVILNTMGCFLGTILMLQLPLLGEIIKLPFSIVVISILIASVFMYCLALVSGIYPAWHASKIQPAQALHYE